MKLEVLVSSLDITSDLLWILTTTFYSRFLMLLAPTAMWGHTTIVVVGLLLPGRTFMHAIPPHALGLLCGLLDTMQHALVGFLAMLWQGLWLEWPISRLRSNGLAQCWPVDNRLELLIANLVAVACICSTLMLAIGLSLLLSLVAVIGWCLATFALVLAAAISVPVVLLSLIGIGMVLHATRLLAVDGVRMRYQQLWTEVDVGAASDTFSWDLDKLTWDRIVLGELVLESIPQLGLNIFNITSMTTATSTNGFTWVASLSMAMNLCVILKIGYRFCFDTRCCRRRLGSGEPRPATKAELAMNIGTTKLKLAEAGGLRESAAAVEIGKAAHQIAASVLPS